MLSTQLAKYVNHEVCILYDGRLSVREEYKYVKINDWISAYLYKEKGKYYIEWAFEPVISGGQSAYELSSYINPKYVKKIVMEGKGYNYCYKLRRK